MNNKKKTDDNLPKNKEYIEKFFEKSEEEIKRMEGESKPFINCHNNIK